MMRYAAGLIAAILCVGPAFAQQSVRLCVPSPATANGVTVDNCVPISDKSPLPTLFGSNGSGLINDSGTIAVSNVSQSIAGANASRNGFCIIDLGMTDMWINPLGAASSGTLMLVPAGGQTCLPFYWRSAINIFGDTAGAAYTAWEW